MKLVSAEECTGCSACRAICPSNAIEIVPDEEGFLVPEINAGLCCKCGLCEKRCPVRCMADRKIREQHGFIAQLKDKKLSKSSASGGAFSGIAKYFLLVKNAVVIGAALCEDLTVRHAAVEGLEELKKLQNSKYVQSEIGDIYIRAKKYLEEGRTVFFTGTPCQIAGLYSVLSGREYENLYTADIVCHGVPSPAFLKREITEESKKGRYKTKGYQFRCKNQFFASHSFLWMKVKKAAGLPVIRRSASDPYYHLFMQGRDFRESCYTCKFADRNRMGDFTFGDCDSSHLYPDFHPGESNSIILLNSGKAHRLWNNAISGCFDYAELDIEKEAECNQQLRRPMPRPAERSGIYEELLNGAWAQVKSRYAVPQSRMERFKLLILLVIPPRILRLFAKVKKKA